jgi:hypothetical protein
VDRHHVPVAGDSFDPLTIDLVTITPDGQTVVLYMVQQEAWTGSDTQLRSLQEKVHNYVAFALDGQMVRTYPEAEGLTWTVRVDSQVGPPQGDSLAVLQHLAEVLPRYGGHLEW